MPTANNFMTLRIIVFMQATESECGPHNVTENGCCHPPQQPVTLRISANNPTTTTQRMVGVDHPITQKMGVESEPPNDIEMGVGHQIVTLRMVVDHPNTLLREWELTTQFH
jgi:hypothetical protein